MGSTIVSLSDQFPVPNQQGLRRYNGGDLVVSGESICVDLQRIAHRAVHCR